VRPVDQTTYGFDDGNCLSACLASILEISIEEIPTFLGSDGQLRLARWLADRGLAASIYQHGTYVPPGYAIAAGPSKRFAGRLHACVAYDGRVVHDPHPSREGLPYGIAEYLVIHGPRREALWFSGV